MDIKINSCVLFRNTEKETDSQPEYKGQVNVEGKLYDIALWVKTAEKTGNKYFSGKVSEPYRKEETAEESLRNAHREKHDAKPIADIADDDMGLPF